MWWVLGLSSVPIHLLYVSSKDALGMVNSDAKPSPA